MGEPYRVRPSAADRLRADTVVHIVAMTTGISALEIDSTDRSDRSVCWARRLAYYLGHIAFGWPMERVAHAFGRNRTTISVACRLVEDARSDQQLDRALAEVEAAIRRVETLSSLDHVVPNWAAS